VPVFSFNKYIMKTFFKIALALQLLLALASCNAQVKYNLNANEFEAGIRNTEAVQVLDVRTPGEFESGHIENSLLADWTNRQEFNRRIAFIDKTKPVYIYCLSGGRSAAAAKKMRSEGFEVYELKGGTNTWRAAGKPLQGEANENQMSMETFNAATKSHSIVLVDFGAAWCPPCRMMEPVLKSLEQHHAGKFKLVKVDGGKDQEILKAYNVTALPVFIIFKDGKEVWRKDGVVEEKEIAAQF
jgi:thioredoxin